MTTEEFLARVNELRKTFRDCAKGMVGEEYAEGYEEALDHLADKLQSEADIEWWNRFCPPDWRLSGYTYRNSALFVHIPTGVTQNISGTFASALMGKPN
jgi:hypothetical protein